MADRTPAGLEKLYCKLGFSGDVEASDKVIRIANALTRKTFPLPLRNEAEKPEKADSRTAEDAELLNLLRRLNTMFPGVDGYFRMDRAETGNRKKTAQGGHCKAHHPL